MSAFESCLLGATARGNFDDLQHCYGPVGGCTCDDCRAENFATPPISGACACSSCRAAQSNGSREPSSSLDGPSPSGTFTSYADFQDPGFDPAGAGVTRRDPSGGTQTPAAQLSAAIDALTKYLKTAPTPPDRAAAQSAISTLQALLANQAGTTAGGGTTTTTGFSEADEAAYRQFAGARRAGRHRRAASRP